MYAKSIQKLNSFNTNDEKNRFVINQCNEMFPDEEAFIQKIRNCMKWRNGRYYYYLAQKELYVKMYNIAINNRNLNDDDKEEGYDDMLTYYGIYLSDDDEVNEMEEGEIETQEI